MNTPNLNMVFRQKQLKWMDAPIKSDKWCNLWFLKDGRSTVGFGVYYSEENAKIAATECIEKAITRGFVWPDKEKHSFSKHSHVIQIPWKEK